MPICFTKGRLDTNGPCYNEAVYVTPRGQPICAECVPQHNEVATLLNEVAIKAGVATRAQLIFLPSLN